MKDPLKAKHLDKGLKQLSEEGAVQTFLRPATQEKMLGAVGMLQFEVVKFRLEDEYNVRADYEGTPFIGVRWLKFVDKKQEDAFSNQYSSNILFDGKDRKCYGVKSEWDLKLCQEKYPEVKFFKNSDYIESHH